MPRYVTKIHLQRRSSKIHWCVILFTDFPRERMIEDRFAENNPTGSGVDGPGISCSWAAAHAGLALPRAIPWHIRAYSLDLLACLEWTLHLRRSVIAVL